MLSKYQLNLWRHFIPICPFNWKTHTHLTIWTLFPQNCQGTVFDIDLIVTDREQSQVSPDTFDALERTAQVRESWVQEYWDLYSSGCLNFLIYFSLACLLHFCLKYLFTFSLFHSIRLSLFVQGYLYHQYHYVKR